MDFELKNVAFFTILLFGALVLFGCTQNSENNSGTAQFDTAAFAPCASLKDDVSVRMCERQIFFSKADTSFCETGPPYAINSTTKLAIISKNFCYSDMAEYKKDSSICTKLPDIYTNTGDFTRWGCYTTLGENANDPRICQNITDENYKETCNTMVIIKNVDKGYSAATAELACSTQGNYDTNSIDCLCYRCDTTNVSRFGESANQGVCDKLATDKNDSIFRWSGRCQ